MEFYIEKNDTIGLIAPASEVKDVKEIEKAKKFIEEQGYKVKIYDGCYFLNQTDEHKILELQQAFQDDDVKAIICIRGGFGSLRILDGIMYNILANNPKIFAGSSDITTLLLQINKICNFKTYHTPMFVGNGKFTKTSFNDFIKTVNGKKNKITPKKNAVVLKEGNCKGILWGGNLSTITSLFGSYSASYVPNQDIILFLEDLNEPVYKIDRMLTQIFRFGRLKKRIKGVVFGDFLDVDDKNALVETLKEFAYKLDVPSVFGYPITHLKTNTTVPVGQMAHFNTDDKVIYFD